MKISNGLFSLFGSCVRGVGEGIVDKSIVRISEHEIVKLEKDVAKANYSLVEMVATRKELEGKIRHEKSAIVQIYSKLKSCENDVEAKSLANSILVKERNISDLESMIAVLQKDIDEVKMVIGKRTNNIELYRNRLEAKKTKKKFLEVYKNISMSPLTKSIGGSDIEGYLNRIEEQNDSDLRIINAEKEVFGECEEKLFNDAEVLEVIKKAKS